MSYEILMVLKLLREATIQTNIKNPTFRRKLFENSPDLIIMIHYKNILKFVFLKSFFLTNNVSQ